ncbi:hypothetical protein ACET3Z_015411 [Daucus carota]
MEVDHYAILGLPSGVQDKTHMNFQRLQNSYEILKDTKTRKAYDDRVRAKHEEVLLREKMRKKRVLAEEKAQEEEERKNVKMRAEMKKKNEPEVDTDLDFILNVTLVLLVSLGIFN